MGEPESGDTPGVSAEAKISEAVALLREASDLLEFDPFAVFGGNPKVIEQLEGTVQGMADNRRERMADLRRSGQ